MIHINLLGEKSDTSTSHLLQLAGFIVAVSLTFLTCLGMRWSFASHLEAAREEKLQLETRLTQLKKITKEVSELEKNKKTLREKLHTIATLMAKQHGPVRILDDLNQSIPEKAWLSSVSEKSGELVVQGVALDNETIALFMHDLEKSPYFGMVDLNHSTKQKVKNVNLKKFSVTVKLTDALKVGKEEQEETPGKEAAAEPKSKLTSTPS